MSETKSTQINPADLPASEWIDYASFAHLMPGTNRRQVEDNAKAGRWIRGVRFSPRKPMRWRAADVARALDLSPTTIPEPGSQDFYDRVDDAARAAEKAANSLAKRIWDLKEEQEYEDFDSKFRRAGAQDRIQEAMGRLLHQTDIIAGLLRDAGVHAE